MEEAVRIPLLAAAAVETVGPALHDSPACTVHRARVAGSGFARALALKRIKISNHVAFERFEREREVLQRCTHPCIVRPVFVVQDAPCYGLVLPLADRGSLSDVLHRSGTASLPRALAPPELMVRGGAALSRTPEAREIAKLLLGCACVALNPASAPAAADAAARCFLDLLTSATGRLEETPVRGLTGALVRDYIGQNFRDTMLSAARAARAFGVSERHIQKLLASGGASFSETLAGLRLEAAAQALAAGGGPVGQVAYDCGFSDLSTFHRAFKARFGETPAAYRAARVRLPPLAVRSTP